MGGLDNEMHGAPEAWLSEMAAYIKELAPDQRYLTIRWNRATELERVEIMH